MLTSLRIKNLALVTDLNLGFEPGFNVITGETGAGKSILIGALGLVLGERADRTLIRSGCDSCTVEAIFQISSVKEVVDRLLEKNGIETCSDEQLLLKRTFTASGTNRQYINNSPATLNVLASIGQILVDIHGPHDHQSIFQPSKQLAILDAFGGLQKDRERFGQLAGQYVDLQQKKAELSMDERQLAQQLDLLKFQSREILEAKLRPDEEEELTAQYNRLNNSVRIQQLSQSALDMISNDESALISRTGELGRVLAELGKLDPSAGDMSLQQESIMSGLRELHALIGRYADRIDNDPELLSRLEERINLLYSLKRKYGATIQDVMDFGNDAFQRLQQLENRESEMADINNQLKSIEKNIWQVGAGLTQKRKDVIPGLSQKIARQLKELGFKQSYFNVKMDSQVQGEWYSDGLDRVEFDFSPNVGEPPKALRAIASSGEMARVMLAIKTVLAAQDDIQLMVFDEVDANVGGETAVAVGKKMKAIGKQRQIFCVTHLAQVAAFGTTHLKVRKNVQDDRTVALIDRLSTDDRVIELARMLGGQSETAIQHARALLETSEKV